MPLIFGIALFNLLTVRRVCRCSSNSIRSDATLLTTTNMPHVTIPLLSNSLLLLRGTVYKQDLTFGSTSVEVVFCLCPVLALHVTLLVVEQDSASWNSTWSWSITSTRKFPWRKGLHDVSLCQTTSMQPLIVWQLTPFTPPPPVRKPILSDCKSLDWARNKSLFLSKRSRVLLAYCWMAVFNGATPISRVLLEFVKGKNPEMGVLRRELIATN